MSPRSVSIALTLGATLFGVPLLVTNCGQAPPTPRSSQVPPPIAAIDGEVMTSNQTPVPETLEQELSVTVRPGAGEPVEVQMSPRWYLEQNGLRYEPGDRIAVEGARTSQGVIVASKVRQGNRTIMLRNASGEPLWDMPPDGGPDDDAGGGAR